MGHARRRGAWLAAALAWLALPAAPSFATAEETAGPLRTLALERLPPGVRPADQRGDVETVRATYGQRLVERVWRAPSNPSDPRAADADWIEVEYTVDPGLEGRLRALLAQQGANYGHVVMMDPSSGDLFAYVSTRPEHFPPTRAYPTASLMKIVTAAAVLRHAPDAAERMCRSVGSPYRLVAAHLGGGGHEPLAEAGLPAPRSWVGSFRDALAISNNQCFARFAVHDVGEAHLMDEIRRAGLLEAPAPHHPPGTLEPIEAPLDLGNLGSGLAGSTLSPLGAVRLAALLAHGELVTPNWVAQVRDAQGLALGIHGRAARRPAWEPEIADTLRGLLEGVVEVGTARRAFHAEDGEPRLGPVPVSGKTGTLRGPDPAGLYQWFVGVAPADAPRIAIATLVVHTEPERGPSASTIAARSLEELFCSAGSLCDASGAEVLYARAAGRAAQARRSVREAVASARPVEEGLDEPVRPLGDTTLRLPRRLLRERVQGEVALRVDLDPRGRVSSIAVDASDLPDAFDAFLVEEVRGWRFTPPRRHGRPVTATVRLPIPIHVE